MMLKSNHGFARRAAGLLVAGAISFGGLALAVPAVAHEEPGKEQVFEKKVIIRGQGDKDVLRHGEAGDLERIGAKCPGEKFEVGSEGGGAGKIKEVHFILCTDKGQSLLPALEKAVTEIEKDRLELDSGKAEILSKLRAKIAELRARG